MNLHPFLRFLRLVLLTGLPCLPAAAQVGPTINKQPIGLSRSLGDKATLSVTATGDAPLSYQWLRDGSPVANATNRQLTLTTLTTALAGSYSVTVSNAVSAVTSEPALLDVDTKFTILVDSPVSRDSGYGMSWGDYDNDGFIDLHSAGELSALLYHNEGNGTFAKVGRTNALVKQAHSSLAVGAGYWADYDNDGILDFFAPTGWGYNEAKLLFRGLSQGAFQPVLNDPVVKDRSSSWSAAWADFNRDGRLDLFLANGRGPNGSEQAENTVYLGQPDGSFVRWRPEGLAAFTAKFYGSTVGDFNGDGFPDVALVFRDPARAVLLENIGGTNFEAFVLGSVGANWGGITAADFDNTGTLDLLSTWTGGSSALFRNEGAGGWSVVEDAAPVQGPPRSESPAWGDYDNDGWLDLFIPRSIEAGGSGEQHDSLWRNNGDGTFTQTFAGSVTANGANSHGAAWGDFDNDGFLDLAVAAFGGPERSRLFHNNGNTNAWILLKLVGTKSNRSALGAKVRLTATIRGQPLTQYRELGTGAGYGQNDPRVHFGLGDADQAQTVEIEWPSGKQQTLTNVAAKQILTVTEPDDRLRLAIRPPVVDGSGNEYVDLTISGPAGAEIILESTRDLRTVEFGEENRVTLDAEGRAVLRSYFGYPPNRFFRAIQR